MKKLMPSEKIQRCILHRGSCITCNNDNCPFILCQNDGNCLACSNRTQCPMCEGDCKKCELKNICQIIRNNWRID